MAKRSSENRKQLWQAVWNDLRLVAWLVLVAFCLIFLTSSCSTSESRAQEPGGQAADCTLIPASSGFGETGTVTLKVETVVSGLEVPWALAFPPGGDILVTERPGRIRLVRGNELVPEPVATVDVGEQGESGLLGLALHPDFGSNRFFYVYYTAPKDGGTVNRVERFRLAENGLSATPDRIILDDIPAASFHDGGRIRFGPDGFLYIGTGDARNPEQAQNRESLSGKILRLTPEGGIPDSNPFSGSPVYLLGIRNTQGFDWVTNDRLAVTDHGPTGELGRDGHDELNFASAGDNLGWPSSWRCEEREGMVAPALVWEEALPPGGAVLYRGSGIPEFNGDLIIATLGSTHLQRVDLEGESIQAHEVYLGGDSQESFGRLREVAQGPDGALYITTSNCDGRGVCPANRDVILRVTGQ